MSDMTLSQGAALVKVGKVSEAVEVARQLHISGERIAAKQEADAIRDAMSETPENLTELFKLYVDLGASGIAEQVAIRVLRLDPNHIAVRRGMAELQLRMWKLDKVRSHLGILIELPGLSAEDSLFAARIYLRLATKQEAELACQLVRRSVDIAGKSSFPTRITLADALMKAGRKAAALLELGKLCDTAQTAFEMATVAELCVRLKAPEQALVTARKCAAATLSPSDAPVVKIMLAHVFMEISCHEEACDLLTSIDHEAICGTWQLRRFHDACFGANLTNEALITAKRLRIAFPDDHLFPERISLLTIMGGATQRVSLVAPERKGFLSGFFGSRRTK